VASIPLDVMPVIARSIGSAAAVLSLLLLFLARKTASIEKQTVFGCLLYIAVSLVLMGFGPWQAPQKFYVKYEARHIAREIEQLQEEQKRVQALTKHMIDKGMVTSEELQ